MSEYVVWYDSSETGAPVLNNAAGSLIGVLDACLVNGFNNKAISSIVVAGGVATVTCTGHGYSPTYGKDILIAGSVVTGANINALNGRKAITAVLTANTFTFAAVGVTDQTATGTITAKRDPLGWVKQYSGTNKAIYKRSDVTATGVMLRVLDTAVAPCSTTSARAFMVESATDVDTYLGQGPTQVQLADGQYWNKGSNTATAKQWSLVGDGFTFYLTTQGDSTVLPSTNGVALPHMFGDIKSLKAGDAFNTLLCGPYNESGGSSSNNNMLLGHNAGFSISVIGYSMTLARSYTQVGASLNAQSVGIGTMVSGSTTALPIYPSPVDNGLLVFPGLPVVEDLSAYGYPVRGILPGVCQLLARYPFSHYDVLDPVVNLPGRKVLMLGWKMYSSPGMVAMDLTGPWR